MGQASISSTSAMFHILYSDYLLLSYTVYNQPDITMSCFYEHASGALKGPKRGKNWGNSKGNEP